ncbi:MAG: tol-pal system protein YbgF [Candidatus Competibacter sp.]|nr:tol-pal system protein YbgF [Candidatus Competibacter sp.]MDG4582567.1 tol-pal system protein YbgF [Candidatus Competibacter sp.]
MSRPRFSWLTLLVLGGLTLPGVGRAQNTPDSALTLELLQRIEQLEAEVRQIRGELEVYRHRFDQLQQENARGYAPPTSPPGAGIPPRAEPPATARGQPTPAVSPAATTAPPATRTMPPTAAGDAQADFDAALGELREGRHARAIAGFQRFLNAYPDSDRASDAQYWLGESYYLGRDYGAAKEAFISLGVRYPASVRLPDALLKLGYIYGETGEANRAREVLQKLVQAYPNTQAASLAERRLQSLR